MNETIFAAIIGILGAIIAAFGAAYLTVKLTSKKETVKEEELIENTRKSLLEALENIYLKGVNQMINDSNNMKLFISNKQVQNIVTCSTTFLGSNIFEVLDINVIKKLFLKRHINFDKLISLLIFIKTCEAETPNSIVDQYMLDRNVLIEQRKKDLDFLFRNEKKYKETLEKEELEIENIFTEHSKGHYSSTLERLDHCKKNLEQLKNKIEDVIKKLK